MARSARFAAMLLLLMWIGPVTWEQTDIWRLLRWAGAPGSASAEPRVIPAGRALILEPGTPLKLRLRNGSTVEGRFLGRTLLDSALYVPRFEAYSLAAAQVPVSLGETLHVALYDGREWTAPFAGYAELTLLLRGPVGAPYVRVPFEFAKEISRANGERVEPADLARAFRSGLLPSAEAIALGERQSSGRLEDRWASALRVAVEDITSAIAELPSVPTPSGGAVLGVLVLAVLVVVLIASQDRKKSDSCGSSVPPNWNPMGFAGVRLTTQPFDLQRRCFVGEPLAAADPWPGVGVPTTGSVAENATPAAEAR